MLLIVLHSSHVFSYSFSFVFQSSNVNDVFMEAESLKDKENNDPDDGEGQTSRLWVDKFSPQHYTELLSDDVSFSCNIIYTVVRIHTFT